MFGVTVIAASIASLVLLSSSCGYKQKRTVYSKGQNINSIIHGNSGEKSLFLEVTFSVIVRKKMFILTRVES
jgi:hypothetical protein